MHTEERLREELEQMRERERTLDEENSRLRSELSIHQVSSFYRCPTPAYESFSLQSMSALEGQFVAENTVETELGARNRDSYAPTPLLVFDSLDARSPAASSHSPASPTPSYPPEAAESAPLDTPHTATTSEAESDPTESSSPSCLNTPTSPTPALIDASLIPLPDTPTSDEGDAEHMEGNEFAEDEVEMPQRLGMAEDNDEQGDAGADAGFAGDTGQDDVLSTSRLQPQLSPLEVDACLVPLPGSPSRSANDEAEANTMQEPIEAGPLTTSAERVGDRNTTVGH